MLTMTAWQPIETAPENGGIIWVGNVNGIRLAFWEDGEEYEHHGSVGGGGRCGMMMTPSRDIPFTSTHWMPVPIPPQ